jgi:hypothetical protein
MAPVVEAGVLALRDQHPRWGPNGAIAAGLLAKIEHVRSADCAGAAPTVQRYVPYITMVIGAVPVTPGSWLLSGHHLAVSDPLSHSTL